MDKITSRTVLEAWCAEVRRRLEEASAPLKHGDPRMLEADRAQFAALGWTPEQLGRRWADENVELPDWPLEAPPWASDVEVAPSGGYHEIQVIAKGREHRSGDVAAWIYQSWLIDLDSDHGHDGPADAPIIDYSPSDDELSWERAFQVAAVLRSAARELRRHEDPAMFGFDPELSEEENVRLEEQADLVDELGAVMSGEPNRVWWDDVRMVAEDEA